MRKDHEKAGYDVTREYYVNDAGNQIANLAQSLYARYNQALGIPKEIGADGYLGSDIEEKGKELARKYGDRYLMQVKKTWRSLEKSAWISNSIKSRKILMNIVSILMSGAANKSLETMERSSRRS